MYDPRREERRKATRVALPDDVEPRMLDPEARRELRTLSRETADLVARHLVMTGRLVDEDPERALAHARAARALAGRVGMVREAAGVAAYSAGEWAEALSELRAARRITGQPEHLAVAADCERALGRPERALTYADDPALQSLPQDQRVELIIVLAGARRDLGQQDAAVLALQDPAKRTTDRRPWAARLWYAYADALLDAGREAQAREWFAKAAEVDVDGATDAADRLLTLDGVVLEDLEDETETEGVDGDDVDRSDLPSAQELAAYAAAAVRPPPAQDAARSVDRGTVVEDAATVEASADDIAAAEAGPAGASAADSERVRDSTPRPRAVAPPTFVAPVQPPEQDLRLFD